MKKWGTIDYINQRIQGLESEECDLERERKERLLRMIKEIKETLVKEGAKGIGVKAKDKDFGNKGYEIKTLT